MLINFDLPKEELEAFAEQVLNIVGEYDFGLYENEWEGLADLCETVLARPNPPTRFFSLPKRLRQIVSVFCDIARCYVEGKDPEKVKGRTRYFSYVSVSSRVLKKQASIKERLY